MARINDKQQTILPPTEKKEEKSRVDVNERKMTEKKENGNER